MLHLYQPVLQDEETFKKISHECYFPLVKYLKNHKNINCTLNIPLSLLEQMDKYGYSHWISDIKGLVDSERVELTGSAAYHPLLTKFSDDIVEEQIILNECAQGYYFGKNKDFDGEDAFVIKNLNGFFPPELAVNSQVVDTLEGLGYSWFVCEGAAVSDRFGAGGLYKIGDKNILGVVRNRNLSNLISFKRSLDISDIIQELHKSNYCVVVFDAEFLGHHYADGFAVLDAVLSYLGKNNGEISTISDYVSAMSEYAQTISDITESSWGDVEAVNSFNLWDDKSNNIHEIQWNILYEVVACIREKLNVKGVYLAAQRRGVEEAYTPEKHETQAIWLPAVYEKIIGEETKLWYDLHRLLLSDWFWWASGKEFSDGKIAYDADFIKKGLGEFEKFVEKYGDENLKMSFEKKKLLFLDML